MAKADDDSKVGRPRLPDDTALRATVSAHVPASVHQALTAEASRQGIPVSSLLRQIITANSSQH